MTVTLEPATGSPEQVLQEILAPHLLTARSGPQGSWLVVRRRVQGPASLVSREEPVTPARPPVFPTHLWLDYHRGPARRLHRAVQALRDEERGLQSPSAVARVD
jgi:hypothetical protein